MLLLLLLLFAVTKVTRFNDRRMNLTQSIRFCERCFIYKESLRAFHIQLKPRPNGLQMSGMGYRQMLENSFAHLDPPVPRNKVTALQKISLKLSKCIRMYLTLLKITRNDAYKTVCNLETPYLHCVFVSILCISFCLCSIHTFKLPCIHLLITKIVF